MINGALMSSKKKDWETPTSVFGEWNIYYQFELDAAADEHNAKCERFYTIEDDALTKPWAKSTWLNPPYGRGVDKWIRKAATEAEKGNTVVCLLPARTDTKWFHQWIYDRPNVRVIFLKGRIKFVGAESPAPFPSMVVVFDGQETT